MPGQSVTTVPAVLFLEPSLPTNPFAGKLQAKLYWMATTAAVICGLAGLALGGEAVWWSPALNLKSFAAIGDRLAQTFDDPVDEIHNGQTVPATDCVSLLALRARGFSGKGDFGFAQERYLGAQCLTLTTLRDAGRPVVVQTAFALTPASVDVLPPTLAMALSGVDYDAAKRAEAEGKSWRMYQPGLSAAMDHDTLIVRDGTGVVRARVYADGDFTGDGEQGLIVATGETVTDGTYSNTKLFLLARRGSLDRFTTVRRLQ